MREGEPAQNSQPTPPSFRGRCPPGHSAPGCAVLIWEIFAGRLPMSGDEEPPGARADEHGQEPPCSPAYECAPRRHATDEAGDQPSNVENRRCDAHCRT
jgi:hypothetical protein